MIATTRLLLIALAACAASPSLAAAQGAAPVPSTTPLPSQVFEWSKLEAAQIPNGQRRFVFDGPTETVDRLHCHITSLAVGKVSGEPVRHLQDEVLIVKEGEVEVSLDGTTMNLGAGSVIFFASGAVTRLRNAGTGPATYYVINYSTPKTPKA